MEDSHTHILSLPDDPTVGFFGVFGKTALVNVKVQRDVRKCSLFLDGHGGSIVAKYASKHLHKIIIQRPEFPSDIPEALKQVSTSFTLDLSTGVAFECFYNAFEILFIAGISRLRHGNVQR